MTHADAEWNYVLVQAATTADTGSNKLFKKKKDNNGGCLQWLHTLAKLNHKKEQKHEDVCVQDQPLPETCIFSGRIPMHTNAGEGLATVPPVPSHA